MEEGKAPRALVFAAGLGTRLKPLTDTMPKALVPVGGQPLLYHVLQKLKASGVRDVVVNVHHFADQIIGWLAANPVGGLSVAVSDERDLLRETGGGIRYAERLLLSGPKTALTPDFLSVGRTSTPVAPLADPASAPGPTAPAGETEGRFLVHNVDILSNLDLVWFASQAPADALATLAVSDRKTQRYFLFREEPFPGPDGCSNCEASALPGPDGCPRCEENGGQKAGRALRLVGWTNIATGEVRTPFPDLDVTACRKLAFSGIHLISNRIFDVFRSVDSSACPQAASVHPQGPSVRSDRDLSTGDAPLGERFSITDFYLRVCAEYPIYGIVPPDFRMIDVGKLDTLAAAEDFLRCERREG